MRVCFFSKAIPDIKLKKAHCPELWWIEAGEISILGSLEELNSLGFQIETLTRREMEKPQMIRPIKDKKNEKKS